MSDNPLYYIVDGQILLDTNPIPVEYQVGVNVLAASGNIAPFSGFAFTANETGDMTTLKVILAKNSSFDNATARLELWSCTGTAGTDGKQNALIQNANTLSLSTQDTVANYVGSPATDWMTFTFTTPVPVVAGTDYAVVIRRMSGDDFQILSDNSPDNPSVNMFNSSGTTVTNDAIFVTETATVGTPLALGVTGSNILYNAGDPHVRTDYLNYPELTSVTTAGSLRWDRVHYYRNADFTLTQDDMIFEFETLVHASNGAYGVDLGGNRLHINGAACYFYSDATVGFFGNLDDYDTGELYNASPCTYHCWGKASIDIPNLNLGGDLAISTSGNPSTEFTVNAHRAPYLKLNGNTLSTDGLLTIEADSTHGDVIIEGPGEIQAAEISLGGESVIVPDDVVLSGDIIQADTINVVSSLTIGGTRTLTSLYIASIQDKACTTYLSGNLTIEGGLKLEALPRTGYLDVYLEPNTVIRLGDRFSFTYHDAGSKQLTWNPDNHVHFLYCNDVLFLDQTITPSKVIFNTPAGTIWEIADDFKVTPDIASRIGSGLDIHLYDPTASYGHSVQGGDNCVHLYRVFHKDNQNITITDNNVTFNYLELQNTEGIYISKGGDPTINWSFNTFLTTIPSVGSNALVAPGLSITLLAGGTYSAQHHMNASGGIAAHLINNSGTDDAMVIYNSTINNVVCDGTNRVRFVSCTLTSVTGDFISV